MKNEHSLRRRSAHKAARVLEQQMYLSERRWFPVSGSDGMHWRHPSLFYVWPLDDAYRLQRSADHGARGLCFQELRSTKAS